MATKKNTLAAKIVEHVEARIGAAIKHVTTELEKEIPELVAQALGVVTGEEAAAEFTAKLVAKAGRGKVEAPKKRGRPKGSKNKPEKAEKQAKIEVSGEEKKKRGRPKGSKNKKMAEIVETGDAEPANGALHDAFRERVRKAASA